MNLDTSKFRVLCSVGTRPEAVKMAPLIKALRAEPWAEVRVLATAQHRGLLDSILAVFGIKPDLDLDIMRPDQTLPELTARLVTALDGVLGTESPHLVLAQGDTTSVFVTALACFYRRIPFGHVEAGLRTGRRYYPFPEEINRVLAGHLASYHFAPTETARANLLREGVDETQIYVTGNTVIDAMFQTLESIHVEKIDLPADKRVILMTAHRRENFGEPFREVLLGVLDVVRAVEDSILVYPVHPNPNVEEAARKVLGGHPRVHLIPPQDYVRFLAYMNRAEIILTDSGGVQEEAPALGKPVLVFRSETERPEAVDAGVVKLVGPNRDRIAEEGIRLLTDPAYYKLMAKGASPYGDGRASEKIVRIIKDSRGAAVNSIDVMSGA